MRRTKTVRLASVCVAALGMVLSAGGSAWAGLPASSSIRPHQFFVGTVNGVPTDAVVDVLCPGPSDHGHALSGQTLQVDPPGSGVANLGFTGSRGKSIVANLAAAGVTASLARFTHYGSAAPFPTSLTLPCSGQGVVSFDPIPNSPTARAFDVTVTFVNLGV